MKLFQPYVSCCIQVLRVMLLYSAIPNIEAKKQESSLASGRIMLVLVFLVNFPGGLDFYSDLIGLL